MKIFNDGFEILYSGTLYSPGVSDTRFVFSENALEIVFRIEKNDGEKGIKFDKLNDYTIAVIFENPKGLGYGLASPVKVGNLEDKELYVVFSLNTKGIDQG